MSHSKCFTNYHVLPADFALWEVGRSMSHKTGELHFDAEKMSLRLGRVSADTVYRSLKRLIDAGWFEVITKPERNKATGRYNHGVYRILPHAEWAAKHSTSECVTSRTDASGPFANTRRSSRKIPPIQSQNTASTSRTGATYIATNHVATNHPSKTNTAEPAVLCPPLEKDSPLPINLRDRWTVCLDGCTVAVLKGRQRGRLIKTPKGVDAIFNSRAGAEACGRMAAQANGWTYESAEPM